MNWTSIQFDGGQLITIEAAFKVGEVMKYLDEHDPIAPRYSFFR